MKNIFLSTIIGMILCLGNLSCSDDYFNIDYYDIVEPSTLLTSQAYIEQGLIAIYDELYNGNLTPDVVLANSPMMDMRPTGWDYDFGNWSWRTDHSYVNTVWSTAYNAIARVNGFIVNLRDADPVILDDGENTLKLIEAQARFVRAYYYIKLVQNYGGVPLLEEGEAFSEGKPRVSPEEVWNVVIADLEYVRGILGWDPWKGEKGRITLGAVKVFLARAYMYNNRFADAKKELKDIIDSGKYALYPCYGQIHLEGNYWTSESIFEISYPVFEDMTWAIFGKTDAVWLPDQQFGAVEYGGWGPQMTSFEFVWSFEPGDKRLEYEVAQYGHIHPFVGNYVGRIPGWRSAYVGDDVLPSNFNMKWWKKIPGIAGQVCTGTPCPRERLAGVYLSYAECCFETEGENSAEGWEYIQKVRDRAWGALEPQSTYNKPFPIALNTDPSVKAPDAKTYYSTYKRTAGTIGGTYKRLVGGDDQTPIYEDGATYTSSYLYTPYTSPAWKVALLMERRHEFYGEYSLWYDCTRMGMVQEYLNAEYPKNNEDINFQMIPNYNFVDKFVTNPHSKRAFEYQSFRELYPIPFNEILRNPALADNQNPGY
ncbi:MAG: RagB/SusD family nutrient uptake outer membrane protein [Tannerellaceae bacterium]|nr:RagB/SusD family nutrient uptake outer membrane protein [Tannerellaceae bacterium]